MEVVSPDGRWFVGAKNQNLWLRSRDDGRSVQLTTDGVEDYGWSWSRYVEWPKWSPDSSRLAVKRVDFRKVNKIPIVHWLKPTEEIEWVPYPRPGGPMPQTELFIVDTLSRRPVRVDTGTAPDHYFDLAGWRPDGSELFFLRVNRTCTKVDLMVANATTGASRVILSESRDGPIESVLWGNALTLVGDGRRFLWTSEREGRAHLYLYDREGHLIRRLTEADSSGPVPVDETASGHFAVVAVDEKTQCVYFKADKHLCRADLNRKGFTRLMELDGSHEIQFAPSREFFLDTHSTLARPPVVELRRADGKLLQTVSKANIDALQELSWSPPRSSRSSLPTGEPTSPWCSTSPTTLTRTRSTR
jgi:hypothetical protein